MEHPSDSTKPSGSNAGDNGFPITLSTPGDHQRPERARHFTNLTPIKRTAYLVVHGMGQQVPYQTVSQLGKALLEQHQRTNPTSVFPVPNVARVSLDGESQVSRVEIELHKDGTDHQAHLYEAYWAPLTEGQIGLWGVVQFLYGAAFRGLKAFLTRKRWKLRSSSGAKRSFPRYIFGDVYDMDITDDTLSALVVLVLLMSAIIAPVAFLAVPALRLEAWKWFAALAITRKPPLPSWYRGLLIVGALLLAGFALVLRYLLIEYIGDVAIYISAYKVSRYDAVRKAISLQATTIAKQIYGYGLKTQEAYDNIVLVGHSLGSVIAYDALNDMINLDQVVAGKTMQVVNRTTRLITFGSPLDKTAFLFRSQVLGQELREAMAALQQPLIQDYEKFRKPHFRWINLFSSRDIISGSIDYYDVPNNADPPAARIKVCNKPDPQARIPLLAHNQYWKNQLLHRMLYEALLGVFPDCP